MAKATTHVRRTWAEKGTTETHHFGGFWPMFIGYVGCYRSITIYSLFALKVQRVVEATRHGQHRLAR